METSAFLDLMVGTAEGQIVGDALRGKAVHVSDHCAVAVAQGLLVMVGRGIVSRSQLRRKIRLLAAAPFAPHPAATLLEAAWARTSLRLGDALCVELSQRLRAPLLTTDSRLATVWPDCLLVTVPAELVEAPDLGRPAS
ncbi:MAG TPA: PIN domain-containing protein [Candidatus Saccharimonadales bacterium]|nr:PIN domain-containing protein [Candidatus Saccharimonadales bacterium]